MHVCVCFSLAALRYPLLNLADSLALFLKQDVLKKCRKIVRAQATAVHIAFPPLASISRVMLCVMVRVCCVQAPDLLRCKVQTSEYVELFRKHRRKLRKMFMGHAAGNGSNAIAQALSQAGASNAADCVSAGSRPAGWCGSLGTAARRATTASAPSCCPTCLDRPCLCQT